MKPVNNNAIDDDFCIGQATSQKSSMDESAVAIIGMACHLPGASNLSEYWSNLANSVESVQFYSDEELLAAGESAAKLAHPNYVRAQPFLKNYQRFDANFWGFNPQDAAVTDPAHRLFLDVAYQALEHAGHTGYDSEGRVGVFASAGENLYRLKNLQSNPQLIDEMGEFLVRHTGNCMNFLATRLSYELDLRGPSINVQTACSSSLVAVHMAVQSLLNGECDSAIVGGSTVVVPQKRGYIYRNGEILSPDGHCRPFDANSQGTVFGSGAGAMIVKRYEDAVADGDTIYGVVRGTAINNDGAQKIGYLAPGVDGQAAVLAEALSISGVDATDVTYIEAHGTGTPVGDPIEFEALNQVYRQASNKRAYCHVGSVKSNIGHLGEAAGIAGIIKVVLALQNKKIPPTINYQSPNKEIDLDNSPFLINNQLVDWQSSELRIAGITALGAGGTNAHVIISEAEAFADASVSQNNQQLLILSAKTETALNTASRNLATALRQQDLNLADVAYTLQIGRRAYCYRRAIAVKDKAEAIFLLEGGDSQRIANAYSDNRTPSLVFMFPGGGAQYAGMGAELYISEAIYRQCFDACLNAIDDSLASEIRDLVFASDDALEKASVILERPSRALPALFATEYALAKQFIAWGAQPTAFVGHSMGEYTAACLAGVLKLDDAMRLVALRGELFEQIAINGKTGGMLSIGLAEADARKLLPSGVDIAAVNAADLCVASGSVDAIEQLQKSLEDKSIDCTRIRIHVAAHSSMLDGILESFRDFCQTIQFSKPSIPLMSNYSGDWISDAQATDPNYWVSHLRHTVRFADNINNILVDDNCVLVEVGPGRTLTTLAQASDSKSQASINAMRHPKEAYSDVAYALKTLGNIWAAGVAINWSALWSVLWSGEQRRRIALPSYPFERKTYWVDTVANAAETLAVQDSRIEKRPNMDDWFSRLRWMQSAIPSALTDKQENHNAQTWLIFVDQQGIGDAIVDLLDSDTNIITVQQDKTFKQHDDNGFSVAANDLAQFEQLFNVLETTEKLPQQIIYLWPTSKIVPDALMRLKAYEARLQDCFWGLFNLSKVLCELQLALRLTVVSSDMHAIASASSPEKATLIGPVMVLPHELPLIETQSIDISLSATAVDHLAKSAQQIVNEIESANEHRMVAYRGADRWVRDITAAAIKAPSDTEFNQLRQGGTYLITGGLGGIGLAIAEHLAQLGAGQLLLLGRRALPDRALWDQWIDQHAPNDKTAQRMQKIQLIEALGVSVMTIAVDVVDEQAMTRAINVARKKFGEINGVIHAAGTMDDQLIMLKSHRSAQQVLDAKIKGALILDDVFSKQSLDFFIVFSSIASFLGLPGQIDYTAANAFLDAFAIERSQRAAGKSLVINWNAWRDIGMVVDGQKANEPGHFADKEIYRVLHPAIDQSVDVSDEIQPQHLLSTHFSTEKHWLLSEHRMNTGAALIPGTGIVELMRAAYSDHLISVSRVSASDTKKTHTAIVLSDLQFMRAFQVADGSAKDLHIRVGGDEQAAELTLFTESDEMPYAIGRASVLQAPTRITVDIESIRRRCTKKLSTNGKYLKQSFMDFGPRWGCVDSILYDKDEALLDIQLPKTFIDDLKDYQLHPSLLDIALGGSQHLIKGFNAAKDFYVPIAYEELALFSAMPATFFSHVRYMQDATEAIERFDVSLIDKQGAIFAEVKGFTMKRVGRDFTTDPQANESVDVSSSADNLSEILRHAITPEEGIEAFNRVMSQNGQAQWIVSSVDSDLWCKQLEKNDIEQQGRPAIQYITEENHDADADEDIKKIEQALLTHQAIDAVIVRSFMDDNEDRRLISYYLPDYDHSITVSDLRRFAKTHLSTECIPQQFIELDELPLNAEGELDRSQLLDPFAPQDSYIEPETNTEKALANIWQAVLGINKIGLSDNFFDMGGHSLLAIRAVIKIDKQFGIRIDQTLIIMNTLEQLAKVVDDLIKKQCLEKKCLKGKREKANAKVVAAEVDAIESLSSHLAATETIHKEKSKKPLFKSFFYKGDSK